jgi:ribosome-associated protein
VELRVDVGASALAEDVKARLRKLAGARMTADGILIIHAHQHRTQAKNREAARARLDDLIERATRRPRPRRATKPSAVARERRVQAKKTHGVLKRSRAQTKRLSDDD